ncbi:MAG: DUF4124 domain-containing protein [Methylococcaceae bacterium]|nr:DUF4124 domain-containing protein [Methylococcaceae bacterium]
MKLFNCIPILLLIMGLPVHAEVFKCKQASGKILYQPSPCSSGTSAQKVVTVKEMTPEQREEAKIKLKTWQDQQAVEEAAKLQAEKERQEELRKQESLELQRRRPRLCRRLSRLFLDRLRCREKRIITIPVLDKMDVV